MCRPMSNDAHPMDFTSLALLPLPLADLGNVPNVYYLR